MLTVLVLYRFHDPDVKSIVDNVVIDSARKRCNVITIERASDDPKDDLYWLKIYHVLRFSTDIVISVKKDGEQRSESITFEQDFISRTSLKGHPFIKPVTFDLSSTLLASQYAAPLDMSFKITRKLLRSPKPTGKTGIWCRFRVDLSTPYDDMAKHFESYFDQIIEQREAQLREFQDIVPELFQYWRYASYQIAQHKQLQSVVSKHSKHHVSTIKPKKPDFMFDFDEYFDDFLINPRGKDLYVISAKMKDVVGKSQSLPWVPWSPRAARRYVEGYVPDSDLVLFSWYLSGVSVFAAIAFILTMPFRPLAKALQRL